MNKELEKKYPNSYLQFSDSFTLIDVLVGIVLVSIFFLGIFAAYQLGLRVVGQSKNKITATAIANEWLEKIRNLPYSLIGTKGAVLPFASGILDSATTTILNNQEYQVEIQIKFLVDEADGVGSQDSCNFDYKRAEVKVSWLGHFAGNVKLATDIVPKNEVEEIQACQTQPGGILSVKVFDAYGTMVTAPLIEIFNSQTGQLVDSATPFSGEYDFPLATTSYKVIVSKSGYSREETFNSGDSYQEKTIITPEKPNPIILENQINEASFSIDKLGSFSVETLSPKSQDFFSDSFLDENKVFEKSNLVIENGEVKLATSTEGYLLSGYLFSIPIFPQNLISWAEFSFTDYKTEGTDLKYQIYYASGTEWYLIPDSDLPGNSTGFSSSVDLTNLSTSTYFQLKLKGNFSTNATSVTPILYDWQLSWINSQPTPIGNVIFLVQGQKIVGLDRDDNPIFKYFVTSTSDTNGQVNITNLEWDNYTFSVDPVTGLDLVSTDPSPQPIGLVPDTNLSVKLYLSSQDSFLLTVQDSETLEPVFSASARLSNAALNYDKTQYTDGKGQTLFIPLENANYNLEISAQGYTPTSTIILISGDTTKAIKLNQSE